MPDDDHQKIPMEVREMTLCEKCGFQRNGVLCICEEKSKISKELRGRLRKIEGYDCYPGTGWRRWGNLVVNFVYNRVSSVFFKGELIYDRVRVENRR
jgi:hypothetical protein